MNTNSWGKDLHISNYIIVYKFILGLFETLLGAGIILFGKRIYELYINFRNVQLLEDPHDLVVDVLEKLIPYILQHRGYIVLVLLLLGLSKMIGAIGLMKHKHWGLDLLIAVTILLLPFEIFTLLINPSLLKLVYFIINLLIALYLVNFNPKDYFTNLTSRIKRA